MGTPDNYMPEARGLNPAQKVELLMTRMRSVIEGAELIRKEINRIQNESSGLGAPFDTEIRSLLGHLRMDLVALRVKFGYMSGIKGPEMLALIDQLADPFKAGSNEDPS